MAYITPTPTERATVEIMRHHLMKIQAVLTSEAPYMEYYKELAERDIPSEMKILLLERIIQEESVKVLKGWAIQMVYSAAFPTPDEDLLEIEQKCMAPDESEKQENNNEPFDPRD